MFATAKSYCVYGIPADSESRISFCQISIQSTIVLYLLVQYILLLLVQWLTESRFGKTKFGFPIEIQSLKNKQSTERESHVCGNRLYPNAFKFVHGHRRTVSKQTCYIVVYHDGEAGIGPRVSRRGVVKCVALTNLSRSAPCLTGRPRVEALVACGAHQIQTQGKCTREVGGRESGRGRERERACVPVPQSCGGRACTILLQEGGGAQSCSQRRHVNE